MPESRDPNINFLRKAPSARPMEGKNFVVMIGVSEYQHFTRLPNAVLDCNRILQVLLGSYTFGPAQPCGHEQVSDGNGNISEIPLYDSPEVKTFYNSKAVASDILRHLGTIRADLREQDNLLIYFAGHGAIVDSDYCLICHATTPADSSSYLLANDLFRGLTNYLSDKKFKHTLLVLDCCYAGYSKLGTSITDGSDYSRRVLTSCAPNETASDGQPGKGSPFSLAFEKWLRENTAPFIEVNERETTKIEGNLSLMNKKNPNRIQQRLLLGSMPNVKCGSSYFTLERKIKDRPDLAILLDSFLDHLDFGAQRSNLVELYRPQKNKVNVITTHGHSYDVQKVLTKVILRWFGSLERLGILINPGYYFLHDKTILDATGQDDIWKALHQQISDTKNPIPCDEENIHNWFFEKVSDLESDQPVHLILWIGFEVGGKQLFEKIFSFATRFSELYHERLKKYPQDIQTRIGHVFIVFSDLRKGEGSLHQEMFPGKELPAANFIPTSPIRKITEVIFQSWIESAKIESTQIALLKTNPELVKTLIGCEYIDHVYEDIVNLICVHCNYTEKEIVDFKKELYEFNLKSLI
ncbi:MAG TPA: caspase family protein [Chryseosolibacter sp.]